MENKGLNVMQLYALCLKQIRKGNGEKHVLLSCDEEGNGYHTLFYAFTDEPDEIRMLYEDGLFWDNNDPNEVVILG